MLITVVHRIIILLYLKNNLPTAAPKMIQANYWGKLFPSEPPVSSYIYIFLFYYFSVTTPVIELFDCMHYFNCRRPTHFFPVYNIIPIYVTCLIIRKLMSVSRHILISCCHELGPFLLVMTSCASVINQNTTLGRI